MANKGSQREFRPWITLAALIAVTLSVSIYFFFLGGQLIPPEQPPNVTQPPQPPGQPPTQPPGGQPSQPPPVGGAPPEEPPKKIPSPIELLSRIISMGSILKTGMVVGTQGQSILFQDSAGKNLMIIDNSGNVTIDQNNLAPTLFVDADKNRTGIGTSNPRARLEIVNKLASERIGGTEYPIYDLRLTATSSDHPSVIEFNDINDPFPPGFIEYYHSLDMMRFFVDSDYAMVLANSTFGRSSVVIGAVRIPEANLQVYGNISIVNAMGGDSFVVNDQSYESGDQLVHDPTPFVIDKDGNVGIGIGTPKSKLQVTGNYIQIPTRSNLPVGTDCDVADEEGRVVFDTTNDNLYICSGVSGWREVVTTTYKRVFITSTGYNGTLGGLSGADQKCQSLANAANLGGTWKAWLSDRTTAATSRLTHFNNPYKLLDGKKIADSWNDLTDGSIANAINLDEKTATQTNKLVWTSTSFNGSIPYSPTNRCEDWTLNSAFGDVGSNSRTDSGWTNQGMHECTNINHLYCFEQ
ncbi:MAG: hypothetical protein HYW24_02880 [Candidatus Aenigmarchaeota archaeon]|nr:hypothetical protein [Candidatus Aenigmarchaeota archaeon]